MTRIDPRATARILMYDIERLPGRAQVRHRGLTIVGDFWDMNSWKHTLGRRLRHDEVVEYPSTLCVAFRWYGQRRTHFTSLWDHGKQGMADRLWEAFNEADIVVGFNHVAFDNRHVRTLWDELDMADPIPWKDVDLYSAVRARNGFESKTLEAITDRLQVQSKNGRYSVERARASMAGNREAQRYIRTYNVGDVDATEAVYDRLRGKIKNHPHVSAMPGGLSSVPTCPECGSMSLKKNGLSVKQVLVYQRYRCKACGKNIESTLHHKDSGRIAVTRGAA